LLRYLLMADLSRIKEIFANTEAESLISEDAAKMALSVKAVLAVNLRAMLYLKETENPFSIRQWVNDDQGDSCIFITSREDMHATLSPLIASWLDVASNSVLSLPQNIDRRIWLILDELGSLKYLPSLPDFMEQSRQFGGCTLMGFHSLPQFHKNFGREGSEEILGVCNTGIHFRSTDKMTSDYISDLLGEQEVEEVSESVSYGANQKRDAVSLNEHKKIKRIVLPTEIRRLDDLQAYLRLKGDLPITKVKFHYKEYPEVATRYIEKTICIDDEMQQVMDELPESPEIIYHTKNKSHNIISFSDDI
jgi:type IV secretory pathway TraG/TraD family ATPase VirD4